MQGQEGKGKVSSSHIVALGQVSKCFILCQFDSGEQSIWGEIMVAMLCGFKFFRYSS